MHICCSVKHARHIVRSWHATHVWSSNKILPKTQTIWPDVITMKQIIFLHVITMDTSCRLTHYHYVHRWFSSMLLPKIQTISTHIITTDTYCHLIHSHHRHTLSSHSYLLCTCTLIIFLHIVSMDTDYLLKYYQSYSKNAIGVKKASKINAILLI